MRVHCKYCKKPIHDDQISFHEQGLRVCASCFGYPQYNCCYLCNQKALTTELVRQTFNQPNPRENRYLCKKCQKESDELEEMINHAKRGII